MRRKRRKFTYSRVSPKNSKRGCLCPDGRTYSVDCCDGSLQAQGIGSSVKTEAYLLTEEFREIILSEDNTKIKI